MEDWAEIRRLYRAEGLSINEIVRQLGVSRNTVRSAVRSVSPPVFNRQPRPSAVDRFETEIRRPLSEHPRMPTTVIAERIGWSRGMTILKDRVRDLRPLFVPPDPCGRTEYRPGELAHWDLWFPPTPVLLEDGSVAKPPWPGPARWRTRLTMMSWALAGANAQDGKHSNDQAEASPTEAAGRPTTVCTRLRAPPASISNTLMVSEAESIEYGNRLLSDSAMSVGASPVMAVTPSSLRMVSDPSASTRYPVMVSLPVLVV